MITSSHVPVLQYVGCQELLTSRHASCCAFHAPADRAWAESMGFGTGGSLRRCTLGDFREFAHCAHLTTSTRC